MQQVLVAVWVI